MADNSSLPVASGNETFANDDIGGVKYPRPKINWGPDGTANDVDVASGKPLPIQVRHSNGTVMSDGTGLLISTTQLATLGQAAMVASQPVVLASNQSAIPVNATPVASEVHVGEVGGKTAVVAVTLSTDTAAYASGDLIADTQQIDAFFRKTDGTGVINSINIIDEDNQGVALYIIFMSTSTSLGTENSAPNITDANLTAGFQGIVSVATTDYVTISGAKVATIKNIGLPVKAVSGTDDIYIAVLNATGTPTFTASGLEMRIGVLLD